MNNRYFFLAIPIVTLIAVLAIVSLKNNSSTIDLDKGNSSTQAEEVDMPQVAQNKQITKGSYQDYSGEALAKATGTKLLFFHASWCPQCRELDESIREAQLPDNVSIFKVDYDSNQALRKKYGVTVQTTVVRLNSSNQEDSKFVPYDNPVWESVKNELL